MNAIIELTVTAAEWAAYHKLAEQAAAAKKAAGAQWAKLGLPENGKEWAAKAKLKHGETAAVILKDGNGNPIAAGTVAERHVDPQPERWSWIAPRL